MLVIDLSDTPSHDHDWDFLGRTPIQSEWDLQHPRIVHWCLSCGALLIWVTGNESYLITPSMLRLTSL